jgi:hypothetical protein
MEDRNQRLRPESSNSAHTRMTPTSSTTSSSAHLPAHNGVRAPSSGGASLLHERLRERKVESARQSRRRSVDLGSNGERGVQSSPVKGREERRPSSSGITAGKGMGVKQIEEVCSSMKYLGIQLIVLQQVSTLHKQNFDLKLELYHRRQRQETLERQLEAAEKQIDEQAELQEVNEQLLSELEKRDQAVEEAVSIIVTLEEKVERLMKEREGVRAFEADYESTYFRPGHSHDDGPPSSTPEFDEGKLRPRKSVPRMPSFLSEPSEGAEALRSLYLPNGPSESTLPKLAEESRDGSPDRMDSPRLSVLSESSFLSVYGEKQLMLDAPEDEELPKRHRSSTAVEKWIDERPVPNVTPVRPSERKPGLSKSQFLSINDVLESPLQRLERLKHTLEKANGSLISAQPPSNKERRKSKEPRLVSTDTNSFERQHPLPPTPDTINTDMLRHFKNSNDTLLQHRKASGTFLNSTSTFPTPRQYQSDLSLRPRSVGETITSRREGHGWDTETQEEFTETGSISSTNSTYNGRGSFQYPKRARTPLDLFTFGGGGDAWGRDVMFNNASHLPKHNTAHRYEHVRRSSMAEHPQSDDTVIPYHSTRYTDDESPQYPLNSTSKPFPPDRRSSLSATTKFRKVVPPNSSPTTNTASSPVTSPEKDSRKSRFSTRFSIRPEKPALGRSQSYVPDEEARATPPPIRRNRTSNTQIPRPISAGGGGFGFDGAGDEVVDGDVGKAGGGGGGKKWFGLGRNNSLRRN